MSQVDGQIRRNVASDGKLFERIWYPYSGIWCENKCIKWTQTLRKLPTHATRMPFEYKSSVNNACSIRFRNPPDSRVEDAADWERRGAVSDTAFFRRRLAQLTSPVCQNRTFSLIFIQHCETHTHIMDYFTKYLTCNCVWDVILSIIRCGCFCKVWMLF